jgi:hypothetical protein
MKKCSFFAEEIQVEAIRGIYRSESLDKTSPQDSIAFKKTNRINLSRVEVAVCFCFVNNSYFHPDVSLLRIRIE